MNSLSVLQHLASNPQLIGQLQNLLTLLAPQDGANTTTTTTAAAGGSSFTLLSSTSDERERASPPPLVASLPSAHVHQQQQQQLKQQQQGVVCQSDRVSTQTRCTARHDEGANSQLHHGIADTNLRDGVSLQRYEQLAGRCHQLEEHLEQKTREAAQSVLRAGQLEKEMVCLMQRVEQLMTVVEEQKRKMGEGEAAHQLEVAEMMNNHELALQSKAAAYEKTLQEVMNAQRLMAVARRYEQVVDGTNSNGVSQLLSTTPTPVNKGPKSLSGSSAKRNVAPLPHEEKKNGTDTLLPTRLVLEKHERNETSSPSPATRSKRRTPRTPSMTAADHVAATAALKPLTVASYSKMSLHTVKTENDSPHVRRTERFAGENEERCAPVVHDPSHKALSPGPATSTITKALARHHHLQQRQQQQQQQRDVTGGGVESRFVAQYGSAVFSPGAPMLSPTPAPTSVSMLSRTPRRKGQHDNINSNNNNNNNNCRYARTGQRSGTSSVVGGPTRSPSPVNPKRGKEEVRCFVLTSLSEEERSRVKMAVSALGQKGVVVDSDYEDPPPFTATHIVVRGPPRSMKALCGVVGTKWLVQPEYIYASQDAGFWLDEYEEGGLRCFPPPLMCQRFLLTMPDGIVKEKLEQVIEYGGGEVVRTPRDGKSQDHGVIVIASGDDLLRFATRLE